MYMFTSFFGKGIAFLLLPYFTNVLSKEDMGKVTLFSGAMLFLIPFISMGLLQSASIEYFKLDKKEFRNFFTTSLLLPVGMLLLSLIVFYFGRDILITKNKFPASFVWAIPVITFFSFLNQHVINMIRNEENKKLFMIVSFGRLFLEIAVAVFFISALKMAWQGRIIGFGFSFIAMGIYAFYYFIKKNYLFGQIKKTYLKEELLFSVPIIIMQFSTFCMNYSDSFFLSRFTNDNNAQVGVYGIACVFASIIIVLCTALQQYITPKTYKLLAAPVVDYKAIRKLFLLYFGIMTVGLLALLAFVPFAYKFIINKNYMPGIRYYYLLCIGYYFWTIASLFFSFLFYYKQKRKIMWLSLAFVCISLTSNYFFIKNMQSTGAAISVFCSYFIILIITLIFTNKQMSFLFKKNI